MDMDIEAAFSHPQVQRLHSLVCGLLIGLTLVLAALKHRQLWTLLQSIRSSLVAFCCNSQFSKLDRQAQDAFEWELSQLVVQALGALLVVFSIRSCMVVLGLDSGLMASMHVTSVLLQIVCLIVCQFPHLVRPSSLVGWNLLIFVLHTLPVLWEPSFVQGSLGRTLPARVLMSVTARYGSLSVALNVMFYLVVNVVQRRLHRTTSLLFPDGPVEPVESDAALPFLEMVLVIGVALIVRHVLYRKVRMSLELKTSTVELSAVSRLLHGFCDAVVELDEDLRLTDARQLSTILLHGTPQESPEKADFLNYFSADDVQRVRDCLERPGRDLPALALNAKMIDSMASEVHVELLHVPFSGAEGRSCHYVGMREVDKLSALAPLQDDRVDLTTSFPSAPSIVFKGATLEVVDADPNIGELCQVHKGTSIFNLTLMDLDDSSSRTSLCGQVQFAINAFVNGSEWAQQPIPLQDLHLLGCKVIAVSFDQATDLLGSLILSPQSQLTVHNLQNLGEGSGYRLKPLRKSRHSWSKGSVKSSRRSSRSASSTSEAAPLSRLSPTALGKGRSSL